MFRLALVPYPVRRFAVPCLQPNGALRKAQSPHQAGFGVEPEADAMPRCGGWLLHPLQAPGHCCLAVLQILKPANQRDWGPAKKPALLDVQTAGRKSAP